MLGKVKSQAFVSRSADVLIARVFVGSGRLRLVLPGPLPQHGRRLCGEDRQQVDTCQGSLAAEAADRDQDSSHAAAPTCRAL
eukprot:scaffold317_cov260-Pinguiococcus_pyrenoidosus.AAC.43